MSDEIMYTSLHGYPAVRYECQLCGATVNNREKHTKFHAELMENFRLAASGRYRVRLIDDAG